MNKEDSATGKSLVIRNSTGDIFMAETSLRFYRSKTIENSFFFPFKNKIDLE